MNFIGRQSYVWRVNHPLRKPELELYSRTNQAHKPLYPCQRHTKIDKNQPAQISHDFLPSDISLYNSYKPRTFTDVR